MSRTLPEHKSARRLLWLCPLLSIAGCAAPKPPIAANAPLAPVAAPLYTGTIAAIRPESSVQDPTGSLQQIMSILGQPAPQPANVSEIVMRMPDNSIKTSVQPARPTLAAGGKVVIADGPTASPPAN